MSVKQVQQAATTALATAQAVSSNLTSTKLVLGSREIFGLSEKNNGPSNSPIPLLRQAHDLVNWASSGFVVDVINSFYDAGTTSNARYFCMYTYSGNTANVSQLYTTNINILPPNKLYWGDPVLISGTHYYRDLFISYSAYHIYNITVECSAGMAPLVTTPNMPAQSGALYIYP